MRELNMQEVGQVSGGINPWVAAIATTASYDYVVKPVIEQAITSWNRPTPTHTAQQQQILTQIHTVGR